MKGVFRQTGYEHQDSYNSERALNSTLFCVVKICNDPVISCSRDNAERKSREHGH